MMTDAVAVPKNRGLFDRSVLGCATKPVEVEVERGRIRFFAGVLGESEPAYFDVAAAREQGYPDLLAPPSYFMVLEALANEELRRQGHPGVYELLQCDFRFLLHGDETYTYLGQVFAGDRLTFSTTVVDFFEKKGGAMEFATLTSTVAHSERGVLITANRTLLHRFG